MNQKTYLQLSDPDFSGLLQEAALQQEDKRVTADASPTRKQTPATKDCEERSIDLLTEENAA